MWFGHCIHDVFSQVQSDKKFDVFNENEMTAIFWSDGF